MGEKKQKRRFKIDMEIETTFERFITSGDIKRDLMERYHVKLPSGNYTEIRKLEVREVGFGEILKRFWIPIAILIAWFTILIILWVLPPPP